MQCMHVPLPFCIYIYIYYMQYASILALVGKVELSTSIPVCLKRTKQDNHDSKRFHPGLQTSKQTNLHRVWTTFESIASQIKPEKVKPEGPGNSAFHSISAVTFGQVDEALQKLVSSLLGIVTGLAVSSVKATQESLAVPRPSGWDTGIATNVTLNIVIKYW